MADVLKEGYMKKEGAGVSFGWKKRLFVLTKRHIAYYDKADEKGRVELVDILEMAPSNKKKHCMKITTQARVWEFQATSDEDRDDWITALAKAAEAACRETFAVAEAAVRPPPSS